jgi:hypothetical protein
MITIILPSSHTAFHGSQEESGAWNLGESKWGRAPEGSNIDPTNEVFPRFSFSTHSQFNSPINSSSTWHQLNKSSCCNRRNGFQSLKLHVLEQFLASYLPPLRGSSTASRCCLHPDQEGGKQIFKSGGFSPICLSCFQPFLRFVSLFYFLDAKWGHRSYLHLNYRVIPHTPGKYY